MASWADDIEIALRNLGGIAPLSEIYDEVKKVRQAPHPKSFEATVRGAIERHSSDSAAFSGNDRFFSASGIGGGVWGLRALLEETPQAFDITQQGNEAPKKVLQSTYRVLRDTLLARELKLLHKHQCQICGKHIELSDGKRYSEAHHIMPLGSPHNGPDVAENILVLCPNHHVMLDYGAIELDLGSLRTAPGHVVGSKYVEYHNNAIVPKAANT